MPANGPVSLTRQTIFCFIPIMDMYAAYHVKKLRWYLLIMIGLGIAMIAVTETMMPSTLTDEPMNTINDDGEIDWLKVVFGPDPQTAIASMLVDMAISFAVAIYFIRKWSKKWNESLSNSN
ncbi:MAG: hypothetical protein GKS07_10325 [Nitrosopumilus sp.]|nr:MAG: hypothetical protein GKS07_10325 [Nitrosopumilus sp.]